MSEVATGRTPYRGDAITPDRGFAGTPPARQPSEAEQLRAELYAAIAQRDSALSQLAEARGENAWRPIDENTPRNGGQILAWGPTNSSVAAYYWAQGRWQASHEGNGVIENQSDFGTNYKSEGEGVLTKWKPLPEPPQ